MTDSKIIIEEEIIFYPFGESKNDLKSLIFRFGSFENLQVLHTSPFYKI